MKHLLMIELDAESEDAIRQAENRVSDGLKYLAGVEYRILPSPLDPIPPEAKATIARIMADHREP